MSEVAQYILGSIVGVLIVGGVIFFLTRFMCRYPAHKFLVAKIFLGFFSLVGLQTIIEVLQKTGGIYYPDLENFALGIAYILGTILGYRSGIKKTRLIPD